MALNPGTRLGHYDVTALLGEGGMGQVWQATDTQLNRQVALKILPDAFAADPDRLARFQREAQILASLNHPKITAIHGIEESEGTRALVLEPGDSFVWSRPELVLAGDYVFRSDPVISVLLIGYCLPQSAPQLNPVSLTTQRQRLVCRSPKLQRSSTVYMSQRFGLQIVSGLDLWRPSRAAERPQPVASELGATPCGVWPHNRTVRNERCQPAGSRSAIQDRI